MGANQMQDGRNNGVISDRERTYLTTVLPTALTLEDFFDVYVDAEGTCATGRKHAPLCESQPVEKGLAMIAAVTPT
jgi:hypothetical protein